jgi:hypothetical protein
MTTKLIAALIIVVVLFGGWELFFYWEKIKNEEAAQKKQAAAEIVMGEQLPGMPSQLEASLRVAESQGAAALKTWLKTYGKAIQDPRKTWIELDYCVLISKAYPGDARKLFAEIKARTPESSPVWPRIKKLEKTYVQ